MPIRYTVTTTSVADDQLASIWLNSPGERPAITRASSELERSLHFDADQKGIPDPVPDNPAQRVLDYFPLQAYFHVSEPDRLVTIFRFEKLYLRP
jgi:hypothetical protein